jgi:hypothetical protein
MALKSVKRISQRAGPARKFHGFRNRTEQRKSPWQTVSTIKISIYTLYYYLFSNLKPISLPFGASLSKAVLVPFYLFL